MALHKFLSLADLVSICPLPPTSHFAMYKIVTKEKHKN